MFFRTTKRLLEYLHLDTVCPERRRNEKTIPVEHHAKSRLGFAQKIAYFTLFILQWSLTDSSKFTRTRFLVALQSWLKLRATVFARAIFVLLTSRWMNHFTTHWTTEWLHQALRGQKRSNYRDIERKACQCQLIVAGGLREKTTLIGYDLDIS